MTLASVHLENFTVFEDARFELCPGINVLLGANATGKTHAMKAMYCALKAPMPLGHSGRDLSEAWSKFFGVFKPDESDSRRLVRRSPATSAGLAKCSIHLDHELGRSTANIGAGLIVSAPSRSGPFPSSLYIPSREVLSMFEGFIAAYQNRELSFDETFYDLCVALSATPLRGERAAQAATLLQPLEKILGGKVVLDGTRFYVQPAAGERYESHLVAEGFRKIATLAHLVANGSISPDGVVFWDEPETNLNPKLITQLTDVLVEFARRGVQIVLATHDYLLSHRLSLLAGYQKVPRELVRFFGLARAEAEGPVTVTAGDTLADLPENPIVEEFARHYDFERKLFDDSHGG